MVSPLLAAWRVPATPLGEGGAGGVGRDSVPGGDGIAHWRGG